MLLPVSILHNVSDKNIDPDGTAVEIFTYGEWMEIVECCYLMHNGLEGGSRGLVEDMHVLYKVKGQEMCSEPVIQEEAIGVKLNECPSHSVWHSCA